MNKYPHAGQFKQALEDKLKELSSNQKIPVDRLRRRIAFDRFLARLFSTTNPRWLLKGGYALECRLSNIARATRDIDFSIQDTSLYTKETVRICLQQESEKDMGDFFSYLVSESRRDITQAMYGGWRYSVECRLAGKVFSKFSIDVAVGDMIVGLPERMQSADYLRFAGIAPVNLALYPTAQHFAEKAHAYSIPRKGGVNSRVRDLVDMVLLIEQKLINKNACLRAIRATFNQRKFPVPLRLSAPPKEWALLYQKEADICGVERKDVKSAFALVDQFWKEIMNMKKGGTL